LKILSSLVFVGISVIAQASNRIVPVTIAVAETGSVYELLLLSSSVTARRVSAVSPRTEGLVSEVLIDDGDSVKAGDVLVILDKVLATLDLASAEATVEEARASLNEAIRRRNEAAGLVKKNHVATTTYKTSIADVKMKTAALNRLDTAYKRQLEIIRQHTVRAPFNGIIARKRIEVGEWVETGNALLELVDVDVLRIDVPVPQRYFGRITRGTPVTLKFDAFPEQQTPAAVTKVIPVGNSAARTFPVRIEFDNKSRLKAPGMSARVAFQLGQGDSTVALRLPKDAIVMAPDGSKVVWLVKGEAGGLHATPVTVTTGRNSSTYVELLSGQITQGDRVVVRGNEILRPGQKVRLIDEH